MTTEQKQKIRLYLFIVLFVWLSFQIFKNCTIYFDFNMAALSYSMKINTRSAEKFKNQLSAYLSSRGYRISPRDITIMSDTRQDKFIVSLPFTWQLNTGIKVFKYTNQMKVVFDQWPEGLYEGMAINE